MGVRGELFSTKVTLQNRTYFFNVKENRLGDLYLNIVESKNKDEGGFERQSVILFAEDLQQFLKGFDESLRVLEKAQRDKRRNVKSAAYGEKPPARQAPARQGERGDRGKDRFDSAPRRKREDSRGPRFDERQEKRGERTRGERTRGESRPSASGYGSSRPRKEQKDFPPRKKRVVVKKK